MKLVLLFVNLFIICSLWGIFWPPCWKTIHTQFIDNQLSTHCPCPYLSIRGNLPRKVLQAHSRNLCRATSKEMSKFLNLRAVNSEKVKKHLNTFLWWSAGAIRRFLRGAVDLMKVAHVLSYGGQCCGSVPHLLLESRALTQPPLIHACGLCSPIRITMAPCCDFSGCKSCHCLGHSKLTAHMPR